jgi:oligopeptidase B
VSDRLVPPSAERRPVTLAADGDGRIDFWYWLRERDDPALAELLDAEAAYLEASTEAIQPLTETVYREIVSRVHLTDVTLPAPKTAWSYYQRTVEGLEHTIHCRRPSDAPPPPSEPPAGVGPTAPADALEQILLDENLLAEAADHFALGSLTTSPDQSLLAYAIDLTGGERYTVRIRDLATGHELEDRIDDAYYGLAFSRDGRTLFYTRPDASMRPYQIWRHALGTATGGDVCVWEEADERFFLTVSSTKDDAIIVLSAASAMTSEVRLLDATDPEGDPRPVEERRHGIEYSIEHHLGEILVLTNDDAENFAVFRAPIKAPGRDHWRPLVAHRDDVRLESLEVVEGFALVHERGHATTAVRVVDLLSGAESVITPPEEAGVVKLADNLDFSARQIRYETTSLVRPPTVHEHDLASGESDVIWRRRVRNYEVADYRTERRWATSADGTKIPVTLAYRTDRPSGPSHCLLYGYGAYEISSDPVFALNRSVIPVLDRGGCYAIAHVRGGGELGRAWYLDGKLGQKMHSFEDYVASARFLIDEGITTPDKLVGMGASAGGLLVGAVANLAPELFAGIVASVPFVDCLTSMLDVELPLTMIEREEWGNPTDDADAYRWIKSYSPYDNVRPVRYPAMLVTGGLNDPRVGYFEPTKWVQKLRSSHSDNAERVLLKMEMSAGHRGPSGRYRPGETGRSSSRSR